MSMRKIRITESGLKQLIMRIVEQVEETQDNIVKILASDFLKIFRYTNSVDAILNTKKYKDSKVVIVGDLIFPSNDKVKTLDEDPVDSYGPVVTIDWAMKVIRDCVSTS